MTKRAHPTHDVIVTQDLSSYFHEQVSVTARKQGTNISPHAAQYVGSVLARFADAKNFFVKNKDNPEKQSFPTLALMWLESFGHKSTDQFFQLQQMGDVALFTSGFLSERIDRTLVDRDYYMAMGGMAYEQAARIRETLQIERAVNIYFELSERFEGFAEILAELSDQAFLGTDRDMLKLYEKWLRSGSNRIGRMLAEKGVIASKGQGSGDNGPA